MGETLGQLSFSGTTQKPTEVRINRVANGFTITGYQFETKIANTLPEALELVSKELE